jgi:2-polyprenyl-3-methyl-5-hydroxy-6-metoxy-1,4-benzoquinol methylase
MKDLFGKAIIDYQTNNSPEDLITETSISEADEMSVAYLFRDFKEMPKLEQKALQLAKGKVLDVGCGAGSHALYLEEKGFDVTAIDISENAIKACKLRGLKNCKVSDVLDLDASEKFDTILLLMNGTGIFGKMIHVLQIFTKIKITFKRRRTNFD